MYNQTTFYPLIVDLRNPIPFPDENENTMNKINMIKTICLIINRLQCFKTEMKFALLSRSKIQVLVNCCLNIEHAKAIFVSCISQLFNPISRVRGV